MTELLPCPFCGHEATACEGGGKWYVVCLNMNCFCCFGEGYDRDAMPDHYFNEENDAITAWNTRTQPKDQSHG